MRGAPVVFTKATLCSAAWQEDLQLLRAGTEIIRNSLLGLHQDFRTRDGAITVLKQAEGFLGGGMHRWVWWEVFRKERLVFISWQIHHVYRYVEMHLRNTQPREAS